jgi:hypothetical protein
MKRYPFFKISGFLRNEFNSGFWEYLFNLVNNLLLKANILGDKLQNRFYNFFGFKNFVGLELAIY